MTDLTLALRLTADGSGLVGAVQLSRRELEQLSQAAANANKNLPGAQGAQAAFTKDQAKAFHELTEKLDPALKRQREFLQGQALLNDAFKSGSVNAETHARFTRLLGEEYERAEKPAARLGGILSRLGIAGSLAVAGIGIATAALLSGLREAAEEEQRVLRLDAVIKATGSAAGLTRDQITGVAEEIKRTTLATKAGVLDAAGALLTFRGIAGQTFEETLRLSQDLAVVMGGDMRSAAFTLGRALQNPIEGLASLRRAGISFNETQRETIEEMVKSGRQADAQRLILAELQRQVGGAGAAEAGGLTGAVKGLKDAWRDTLQAFGEAANYQGAVTRFLNGIRDGILGIRDAIGRTKEEQLDFQQAMLAFLPPGPSRDQVAQNVARLKAEIQAQSDAQRQAIEQAAMGQENAQFTANRDLVLQRRREMDKALAEVSPTAKQAFIRREGDRALQGLEELRGKPGVDNEALDRLIEDQKKQIALQLTQAAKPLKDNERAIQELQNQLVAYTNSRETFVETAVHRLNEHATPDQIKRTKELAGAIFDEAKAEEERQAVIQKALREGREEEQARAAQKAAANKLALDDAAAAVRIKDAIDPAREYNRTLDEADRLLARNMITAAEYAKTMEDAELRKLDASKKWEDGVSRAWLKFRRDAEDSAAISERAIGSFVDGSTDEFARWRRTGEFNVMGLADIFVDQMFRMATAQVAAGIGAGATQLWQYLSGNYITKEAGLNAYVNPDLAHSGGVIGSDALASRAAPASLFINAPRFHTGLMPGEFPAILEKGETVLPKGMALGGGGGVRIFDQRGSQAPDLEVGEGRDAMGQRTTDIFIKDSVNRTAASGGFNKTFGSKYGLSPVPNMRQ